MSIEKLPEEMRKKLTTKIFVEHSNCLEELPEIAAKLNTEKRPLLLVSDKNTRKAAGEQVEHILSGAGVPFTNLILAPGAGEKTLSADYKGVIEIRDHIQSGKSFPLAIGSGVINDLVKRASFEAGTAYICAATASSMDGYASFGAALVKEGYKLTMPCDAPAAIAADPAILLNAPYSMTASGYGDLYAKLAAGVDWILADHLGLDPIPRNIWDLVQKDLPAWVGSPEKLKKGDREAFSGIFRGLTMSGIAMQVHQESRPASGAEHMISHIWEMAHLSRDGVPFSHGFKVAVGTVLTVSLMEALYNYPPEKLSVSGILTKKETWEKREADIRKAFPDKKNGDQIVEASRGKWLDEKAHAKRAETLIRLLPELKKSFAARVGSREKAVADLQKAGCPVSPAELDLGKGAAREAIRKAQMIRKRYTILDAVYELGLLEELSEAIDG